MAENNKGIYFTELALDNVRCFGEKAILKLSNDKGEWTRWNIILGDNGTGKTTLLQCLAGMELVEDPILQYDIDLAINTTLVKESQTKEWSPKLFLTNKHTFHPIKLNSYRSSDAPTLPDNFRVLAKAILYSVSNSKTALIGFGNYLSSSRINWRITTKEEIFTELYILGYGANRAISFNILSEKEVAPNQSETLFDDDAKLINAEEWLYQMDYAASYAENNNSPDAEKIVQKRNLAFEAIIEILPDITAVEIELEGSPAKPTIKFKTPYGWVRLGELSYGYKTMVAWIVDVAARMFKRYPDSDNPLDEPVVILVDEIDLHLHPKWQRQIFDFLEKRFPRAQFVVTAHSPLIVQSAPKDANIIVLRKEQQGDEYVVKIENDHNYVRNWRVDQILASDLFDNVGIRNEEVEQQMQERTTLLQKDVLTDDEKVRLEELNAISDSLPTANNPIDIEAMDIIRRASVYFKNNSSGNDQNQ